MFRDSFPTAKNLAPQLDASRGQPPDGGANPTGGRILTSRERLHVLLNPQAYRDRWSFSLSDGGQADHGIPLEELEASLYVALRL